MIDDKTKDIMDLYDIKQIIAKAVFEKKSARKVSNEEFNKFFKYLNHQIQNNKSKNNLDNRIAGLYKAIQKQCNNYEELNEIIG